MKEARTWELCWLEPGGTIQTQKVTGYANACHEAHNLRHRMKNTPGVRIWIMSEF